MSVLREALLSKSELPCTEIEILLGLFGRWNGQYTLKLCSISCWVSTGLEDADEQLKASWTLPFNSQLPNRLGEVPLAGFLEPWAPQGAALPARSRPAEPWIPTLLYPCPGSVGMTSLSAILSVLPWSLEDNCTLGKGKSQPAAWNGHSTSSSLLLQCFSLSCFQELLNFMGTC